MNNPIQTPITQRLVRNPVDKRIAGVCSGLADYFAIDPIIVRVIFVALAFAGGAGLLLYPILWLIMPTQGTLQSAATYPDQTGQNVQASVNARFDPMTGRPLNTEAPRFDPYTGQAVNADETAIPLTNATVSAATPLSIQQRRRRMFGMTVLGAGLFVLINGTLGLHFGPVLFPLLLIGVGLMTLRRNS